MRQTALWICDEVVRTRRGLWMAIYKGTFEMPLGPSTLE